MNEKQIILTKESSLEQVKSYFIAVLNLSQSSKEFPVDFDEVWRLVYMAKNKAVEELKDKFLQDVDFQLINRKVKAANPQGYVWEHKYFLTTSCLEFFIARKVRSVFEVYRQVFHKAIASTPSYQIDDPIERAKAWIVEQEQRKALEAQNAAQAQAIEQKNTEIVSLSTAITEMQPKVSYVDTILQCKDTVHTTAIAQDYGKSAKAFNVLLRNLGIQHKVGPIWVLYAKYLSCGYVQSETFTYDRADGTQGVRINTKWTQRGRLFLYETLQTPQHSAPHRAGPNNQNQLIL